MNPAIKRGRKADAIVVLCAFLALCVIGLLLAGASGCATSADPGPSTQPSITVEDIDRAVAEADQKIAQIDAVAATLPPGDPQLDALAKVREVLVKGRETADALAVTYRTGVADPRLAQAIGTIPGIGPYAALLVMLGGWALTELNRRGLLRKATQVIASMQAANLTDEQKKVAATIQDTDTKALVANVKAKLPITPAE